MTDLFRKYQECLRNGQSREALICRNEILNDILSTQKTENLQHVLDMAVEAALLDFSNKGNRYSLLQKSYPSIIPANACSLLSAKRILIRKYHDEGYHRYTFDRQQYKYMSSLANQSIHIIGPTLTLEEQLNMFTSLGTSDCIYILLNPLQSQDYVDQIRRLSSRNKFKHICYFNGSNSLKYFRSLCRSMETAEHQPLWTSHKSSHLNTYLSNSRQFCVPSFLPFSSYAGHSLNLMPLILYDISLASPNKLYISGFDFYSKEWWHYQLFNSANYPLIQNYFDTKIK